MKVRCTGYKKGKKVVPHLVNTIIGGDYGEIGKETNYKDAVGRKLNVGDVVELFDKNGKAHGYTVVVESETLFSGKNTKQFVSGIEMMCNDKTGTISGGWKIIKKRSYTDVKNGETVDFLKYVKE